MKPKSLIKCKSVDYTSLDWNDVDWDEIESQVNASTPVGVVEQIATQTVISNNAKERIKEEGTVIRDMKGSVIAHPAIKIQQDAGKIISDLLGKNKL